MPGSFSWFSYCLRYLPYGFPFAFAIVAAAACYRAITSPPPMANPDAVNCLPRTNRARKRHKRGSKKLKHNTTIQDEVSLPSAPIAGEKRFKAGYRAARTENAAQLSGDGLPGTRRPHHRRTQGPRRLTHRTTIQDEMTCLPFASIGAKKLQKTVRPLISKTAKKSWTSLASWPRPERRQRRILVQDVASWESRFNFPAQDASLSQDIKDDYQLLDFEGTASLSASIIRQNLQYLIMNKHGDGKGYNRGRVGREDCEGAGKTQGDDSGGMMGVGRKERCIRTATDRIMCTGHPAEFELTCVSRRFHATHGSIRVLRNFVYIPLELGPVC
ncbi:hypothetical protein C8R43DRAFT_960868 [Mycena crocata]|nr:hypothetical protein C8R43DRAFT_960868 [Mycena crocata]